MAAELLQGKETPEGTDSHDDRGDVTHKDGVRAELARIVDSSGKFASLNAGNSIMPILMREVDLFPADLLDDPELGVAAEMRWWALYTKARHEKELMRRLHGLNVAFYTPLIARRSRGPSGRTRIAHVPLFTSYTFIYGSENDRYRALTTNCVSRWLPVADGVKLTRDLRQIHQLIESGAPLTPEARLGPGTPVRVRSGPLAGIEGVIISRPGPARLVVSVNFLQQGASLFLEDCHVERLD